jgi:hypothetical protein
MINPFKEINWKPDRAELRKFGWSLMTGFPIIALIFFTATSIMTQALPSPNFFLLLGGIGAAVGLVSLLVPALAKPFYTVWYGFAGCIGIVMTNLLFMLIFYGLFTSFGLFMRLIRRDALGLKRKGDVTSYWKDAPPEKPAIHYFRQY